MLFSLFYRSKILDEEPEKKKEKVEVAESVGNKKVRVIFCVADYKQFVKPLTPLLPSPPSDPPSLPPFPSPSQLVYGQIRLISKIHP